jgi:hypothetical protein
LGIKSLMFAIPPRFPRSRRSARDRPSAWPFARCLPRPWPSGVSALSPTRPGGVDSDAARTNSKDKFRYLLVLFGSLWLLSVISPGACRSRKNGPRKIWPGTVKKRSNFITQDRRLRKLTKSAVKFSSPVAGRWVSTLNEECPSPLVPCPLPLATGHCPFGPFSKYFISWSGLVPVWSSFEVRRRPMVTLLVQKRSCYEPSTTAGT